MLDDLGSSFEESDNEKYLPDGSSEENEVALGEDDSDIETEFDDGIRYMLAEGESGSLGSDDEDLGNIDCHMTLLKADDSSSYIESITVNGSRINDADLMAEKFNAYFTCCCLWSR